MILELMLPRMDGLLVCQALRRDNMTAAIPIIMLTALGEEADRVRGLELGADDYVTKPFSPKELVARVGAMLRRADRPVKPPSLLTYGALTIGVDRHEVKCQGDEIRLTAKEFLLLRYLISIAAYQVGATNVIAVLMPHEDELGVSGIQADFLREQWRNVDAAVYVVRPAVKKNHGRAEALAATMSTRSTATPPTTTSPVTDSGSSWFVRRPIPRVLSGS